MTCYPDVPPPTPERIVLVLDNLNTHDFSALYETFEPEEAWRIREKIEIHYTPKHGSWLNMAEIELAVLSGQCLDRRIGEEETLRQEIAAWEKERNAQQVRVNWRFTTQDARIKLKRLYAVLEHVGAEICVTRMRRRVRREGSPHPSAKSPQLPGPVRGGLLFLKLRGKHRSRA